MHRALSVGELNLADADKRGIDLDRVLAWAGRQVVKGWKLLRSDALWNSALEQDWTELYHGEADQFWELDSERMWTAGWVATLALFQGDPEEFFEEEEAPEDAE